MLKPAQQVRRKMGRDGNEAGALANLLLQNLGSLRFTLIALLILSAAVIWVLWQADEATTILALPFAVLAANLGAAIIINPLFRRQLPLLSFHIALLLIIILITLGRLTYLRGHTEVSQGAVFDGRLTGYTAGPLHPWHLDQARFVNQGFEINYDVGPRRRDTFNRVSWMATNGKEKSLVIGDQHPLVLAGYRFYSSFNKGFAPVFTWASSAGGKPVTGDLHMPSYPEHSARQTAEWIPPGGDRPLWFLLKFDEVILPPGQTSRFRPPEQHVLVLRAGKQRFELKPGERANLREGTLDYHGIRTWMGYTVHYDWTRPWLLAACLFATFSLGAHFYRKFTRRSWLETKE